MRAENHQRAVSAVAVGPGASTKPRSVSAENLDAADDLLVEDLPSTKPRSVSAENLTQKTERLQQGVQDDCDH